MKLNIFIQKSLESCDLRDVTTGVMEGFIFFLLVGQNDFRSAIRTLLLEKPQLQKSCTFFFFFFKK